MSFRIPTGDDVAAPPDTQLEAAAAAANMHAAMVQDALDAVTEAAAFRKDVSTTKEALAEAIRAAYAANRPDAPPHAVRRAIFTMRQRAYNRGRAEVFDEFKEDRPFKRFVAIRDDRTTDICRERHGVSLPVDDPWWDNNTPPLHFNCRSTIVSDRAQRGADNNSRAVRANANARTAPGFGDVTVPPDMRFLLPVVAAIRDQHQAALQEDIAEADDRTAAEIRRGMIDAVAELQAISAAKSQAYEAARLFRREWDAAEPNKETAPDEYEAWRKEYRRRSSLSGKAATESVAARAAAANAAREFLTSSRDDVDRMTVRNVTNATQRKKLEEETYGFVVGEGPPVWERFLEDIEIAEEFVNAMIRTDLLASGQARDPGLIRVNGGTFARAFARANLVNVNPRSDRADIIIHEMFHVVERDEGFLNRSIEWINRRTRGDVLQSLNDVENTDMYDSEEKTMVDKFIDPYIGKQYTDDFHQIRATEALATGMEMMYRNPIDLAQRDPDYFDFLISTLRGELPDDVGEFR